MQPEQKTRKYDTPSLFDPLPARSIPVGTIGEPAYVPDFDAEEESAVSTRSARPTPKPKRDTPSTPATKSESSSGRGLRTKAARSAGVKKVATKALPVKKRKPHKPVEPLEADVADEVEPEAEPVRRRLRAPKTRGATAETLAAAQRSISVSEFFAKNRHLLGFDNKRKALLTTVKEAVDNSLDACEEAGLLPELHVVIDQLAEDRFKMTVRDNGPGIVKAQIPNIFGKLLYGSKFHRLKMARGQQGIGISAAGMYGMLTTGRSVHVTSRTGPKKAAHHFQIQIDTAKNRPDVIKDEEVEVGWERGTEVAIELIASYSKGKQSVDEYIEQTAIANPHAQIWYVSPTGEHREFPRGSEELPAETRAIQPHPHGIELGVLMKMLKESKGVKLLDFLQKSFCRVSQSVAERICRAAGLSTRAAPNTIGTHDVEKLYEAIQSVKIMAPPTNCLAPIGVRNLLTGLLKEVKAEFFTATTRGPAVYRGNPFQIEIALAYGGTLSAEKSARVIRFANRVPLMYQQSACAAFKSVLDVDWRNYSLSQPSGSLPTGPLVVMVHMASVWVPFTSESKEAIADYDEIRREMKLALQECGRKLATYVRRRRRQRLEAQKRDIFGRYIPDVAEALANLAGGSEDRLLRDLRAIARTRTAEADVELDEDGKPIVGPAASSVGPASGRSAAVASDSAVDEAALNGDDCTVIVPENEKTEVPEDLFDDNGNGSTSGRTKRRRRKR